MSPRKQWALLLSLGAALISLQAASNDSSARAAKYPPNALATHLELSANPHIKPYAYILSTAIWPTRRIFVCWDNPTDEYKDEMQIVRTAVADSWEKYSGLTFSGWEKCGATNAGIRITISDEGPYTRGLGKYVQTGKGTQPGGMVLNFTFGNWSQSCQDSDRRNMCIRSIAMHEFGHAIGFAHEQNRPEVKGECARQAQGPNGNKELTPYDPNSIMNYCFDIYQTGVTLSKLDISALRQLYGTEDDKLAEK